MLKTRGDKIFLGINAALLILITLVVFYPLYFVTIASFSDPAAVSRGDVFLLPKGIQISGYQQILKRDDIWLGYRNSICYTIGGTLLDLVVTVLAAYALSRKDLVGRNFFTILFSFTMFFSGGLIPTYLTIKGYGLVNKPVLLIILGCVNVHNMIVCRTFFSSSIPEELREASMIDGCGNGRFFFSIVMPLSKAIIAVMTIYFASGHWNSYFNAMIYLTNRSYTTLQLVMRELLINASDMLNEMNTSGDDDYGELITAIASIRYGVIILSSIPMLIAYPFVQKYFMKGVMMGALKG